LIHQIAFDNVKTAIAIEVVLVHPDFTKPFDICTDASTKQLLAIVETLKEFNGMLWGQRIIVYTDHKNLTGDGLGLTSGRAARWKILLEEYAP